MFAVERKAYFLLSSVAFPFLAQLGSGDRRPGGSAYWGSLPCRRNEWHGLVLTDTVEKGFSGG
jgi:hypothetical protein